MDLLLKDIACARSGDKGPNANVGLVFKNKQTYEFNNYPKNNPSHRKR